MIAPDAWIAVITAGVIVCVALICWAATRP